MFDQITDGVSNTNKRLLDSEKYKLFTLLFCLDEFGRGSLHVGGQSVTQHTYIENQLGEVPFNLSEWPLLYQLPGVGKLLNALSNDERLPVAVSSTPSYHLIVVYEVDIHWTLIQSDYYTSSWEIHAGTQCGCAGNHSNLAPSIKFFNFRTFIAGKSSKL